MLNVMTKHNFWMTVLVGADDGLAARLSCDQPARAKDGENHGFQSFPVPTELDSGDLWEAETNLLLGRLDGSEALAMEALIARHRATDCN